MQSKKMSLGELNKLLQENPIVLAYFSGEHCNVCKAIYPKIESLVNEKFPKIKLIKLLNEKSPEVFGQNQVFSIPTIIVYFEGKEFIRKIRNFSINELEQEISKPYKLFFE